MLRLLPLVVFTVPLTSCGLVKAPFKIAGAVTNGAYQGGKKAVNATSGALERRKERKEQEKEAAAKAEAKKQMGESAIPGLPQMPAGSQPILPNESAPVEGPIIPLSEPLAPPQ